MKKKIIIKWVSTALISIAITSVILSSLFGKNAIVLMTMIGYAIGLICTNKILEEITELKENEERCE